MTIIEDDLTKDIIEAYRAALADAHAHIYKLESVIEAQGEMLREYEAEIDEDKARIKELEEGSCRFNCRTQKQAYFAGFDAGMDQGVHWNDRHEAYEAFRKQNGESDE